MVGEEEDRGKSYELFFGKLVFYVDFYLVIKILYYFLYFINGEIEVWKWGGIF